MQREFVVYVGLDEQNKQIVGIPGQSLGTPGKLFLEM